MDEASYRFYTKDERTEIESVCNYGTALLQKNSRLGVDMGDCILTRKRGEAKIYAFTNPVRRGPEKLSAIQCKFIGAHGKLPTLALWSQSSTASNTIIAPKHILNSLLKVVCSMSQGKLCKSRSCRSRNRRQK